MVTRRNRAASRSVAAAAEAVVEQLEQRQHLSVTQNVPDLTMRSSTPSTAGNFGDSVAAGSNFILIGEPNADPYGTRVTLANAGTASVRDMTTGSETKNLIYATGVYSNANLGWNVNVLNGNPLVGEPNQNSNETGIVVLFDKTSGAVLQTFKKATPGSFDKFGTSVAVSPDQSKVLIGATGDSTAGSGQGAAYLFDANTGALLATYLTPHVLTGGLVPLFGASVAFVGNNVAIGAPNDNALAQQSGAVFVYSASATGTVNTPLYTLHKVGAAASDYFGSALAGSSTQLLVGVARDDTGATDAGAAFLYDGATGSLIEKIVDPTVSASAQFGTSVAIQGNIAIIGAPGQSGIINGHVYQNVGAAFLDYLPTNTITNTFYDPTPNSPGLFGQAVAFAPAAASGAPRLLIGAPSDNYTPTGSTGAGTAYLFTVSDNAPVANAGADQTVSQGTLATLSGAASTDPDGAADLVSYKWDLNNDGIFETSGQTVSNYSQAVPGTYTVGLQVTDRVGETSTATTHVTIVDTPPTANAGSNQTVNEGDTVSFSGTASPGFTGNTIVSYEWDFNYNGTTFNTAATGTTASTSYADNGTHTVAFRATDNYGGSTISTLVVTVNNVAPTVSATGPLLGFSGSALSFGATFADPGTLDSHQVQWDFGDGTVIAFHSTDDTGAMAPNHTFTSAGIYTVTVSVLDKDGGVGTSSLLLVIL